MNMSFDKEKLKNQGMTLPEVSMSLMVMVIFMSSMSLAAKFFQSNIKTVTAHA